ncbi:hypothetical protein BDN72DRAFT_878786 [Pluteus cervinus]|uniref:Uncharacterized protein n=1 Tax=Pluteus cervinus TaxID=181527 RepID=A0ACD3ATA4_9AGAR|nr:hypothetical protein BDN72DRAFT_878786 [Pluteus cervinus]
MHIPFSVHENSVLVTLTDRNQEERNRIDEDIQKLQNRILELLSARNRLAPVAQLPYEILTKVFLLTRDCHIPPFGWTSLTVSWVCRHWRAVTLNCRPLWSIIDYPSPSWAEGFLERSGKARLRVYLPQMKPRGLASIPFLLESLPRIAILDLGACEGSYVCGSEWDAPAPALKQLILEKFTLPNKIFSGSYPSLRSLSLTACVANWTQIPASLHLVDLHIIKPSTRISAVNLPFVLQCLPKLETLELDQVLLVDGITPNSQPRISLGSLTALNIQREATSSIIALFHRLSIPPSAQLSLRDLRLGEHGGPSNTILAVQGSRFDPTRRIVQLWVDINIDFHIRIRDTNLRQCSAIDFSFHRDASTLSTQQIMDICHSLPLTTLFTLDIHGKLGPYEPAFWRHTLGNLPRLRALSVGGHFARHFLLHLKEEAERLVSTTPLVNPLGLSQNDLTFRKLKTLVMADLCHTAPPRYEDVVQLRWALGVRASFPDDLLASFGHVAVQMSQEVVPSSLAGQDDDDG